MIAWVQCLVWRVELIDVGYESIESDETSPTAVKVENWNALLDLVCIGWMNISSCTWNSGILN